MTYAADMRSNWQSHLAQCPQCRGYDPYQPATLAGLCANGAAKLKDWLAAQYREHGNDD